LVGGEGLLRELLVSVIILLDNVGVERRFDSVKDVGSAQAKLKGIIERDVENSEYGLGNVASLFPEQEVVKCREVSRFIDFEEHIVVEIDICVKLDLFDNAS
jgi:hypothetical protein